MNRMYELSIIDHRKKTLKRLRENEEAYAGLENKNSVYARGIKELQDRHRAVYEIYANAPDSMVTDSEI